jgi:cytochrome c-type biogenesis protein CcmH
LKTGDNDGQVVQFLVARYGEFILLRPPLSVRTYALWAAPLLIFLIGFVLARRLFSASGFPPTGTTPPELTDEEQRKLRDVLGENAVAHGKGGP